MNKFLASLALAVTLCFVLVCCSDDDSIQVIEENITVQSLTNTLVNHDNWRLTEFSRAAIDHAADYNGVQFFFNDDNTVTATSDSEQVTGQWEVFAGQGTNNPNTPAVLSLNFSDPSFPAFMPLSDNWLAIERNGTYMRFKTQNGPEFDYISFTRN